MRPRKPRNSTLKRMIAASVTVAMTGCRVKLFHAAGARLRPMRATIAPATTGGMSFSIQRVPTFCTMRPTSASSTPVTATLTIACVICAVVSRVLPPLYAWIGAMKANDDPR